MRMFPTKFRYEVFDLLSYSAKNKIYETDIENFRRVYTLIMDTADENLAESIANFITVKTVNDGV